MRMPLGRRLIPVCILVLCTASVCAQDRNRHSKLRGLERIASLDHPHGYGIDFVKKGDLVYFTKRESGRKLGVIDVSDPKAMEIVADLDLPWYSSNDICRYGDLLITNNYHRMVPVSTENPDSPRLLEGLIWRPDKERRPRYYALETRGDRLYLAYGNFTKAFRVFRIANRFTPELLGTADISQRLSPEAVALYDPKNNVGPRHVTDIVPRGDVVHVAYYCCAAGFDVSDPKKPRTLYVYAPHHYVEGLAVAGRTLFVSTSNRFQHDRGTKWAFQPWASPRGIVILDIRDPDHPREIGAYKGMDVPIRAVADESRLFLVGLRRERKSTFRGVPVPVEFRDKMLRFRSVLQILDIHDPRRPRLLGQVEFPRICKYRGQRGVTPCYKMLVEGDRLYVGDHYFGLRVFDVSDPQRPSEIGSMCTVTQESNAIIHLGRHSYLCTATATIPLDLGNPEKPRLDLANALPFPLHNSSAAFDADGPRLVYERPYWFFSALAIMDFRSPGQPQLLGFAKLPEGHEARYVKQHGERVLVLATRKRRTEIALLVYEPVSGGRALKLIGETCIHGFRRPLPFWGGVLFGVQENRMVALGRRGKEVAIITMDITDLQAPKRIGFAVTKEIQASSWVRNSDIFHNNVLYVPGVMDRRKRGRQGGAVVILNLTDPDNPVVLSKVQESEVDRYDDLTLLSPYRYLAVKAYRRGLRLVDVRDPRRPGIIWREPFPRPGSEHEGYATFGWCAGLFKEGLLYSPRLDHLDIWRLVK